MTSWLHPLQSAAEKVSLPLAEGLQEEEEEEEGINKFSF